MHIPEGRATRPGVARGRTQLSSPAPEWARGRPGGGEWERLAFGRTGPTPTRPASGAGVPLCSYFVLNGWALARPTSAAFLRSHALPAMSRERILRIIAHAFRFKVKYPGWRWPHDSEAEAKRTRTLWESTAPARRNL